MMVTGYHQYGREVRGPDPNSFALIARPTLKNPNKILADRRQREEDAAAAAELEKQKRFLDMKDEWVNATNQKIKANLIRQRFQMLQQQKNDQLETRRQRLRNLLDREEEEYRRIMIEKKPTVIDRQNDLMERAKRMKEKRETERLAFVQTKLEQQFREGCEELRSTVSKQHTLEIAEERLEQIKMKQNMERLRKEEDDLFAKMWLADMEAKLKQEQDEKRRNESANREMFAFIEQQIATLNAKRAQEKKLVEEEARLLKEEQELRKVEEVREAEMKQQKQKELRDMYTRSIELKRAQKAKEAAEERAFDMKMLEQLFEKTKAQANVASEKKNLAREEERRYKEYLKLLKEDEARKEEEMERICQLEIEKDWQKRLNKWKQEKEARQALLNEVIEARRQQIEDKLQANLLQREEAKKERELLLQMIENNHRIDQEMKDRLWAQNRQHQQDLLAQIAYNRRQAENWRFEEQRVWSSQKQAEAEFLRKVEDFRSRPAIDRLHPLKRHLLARSSPSAHF